MLIVGCDPGANGGFALIRDKKLQSVLKSEIFPKDFAQAVSFYACEEPIICVIESVHGVEGQNAGDSFAFGYSTGRCHLMLEMVTGEYVRKLDPAVWMPGVGVPKGLKTKDRKALIREIMLARHGWEERRMKLWSSDAVAIATHFSDHFF